MSRNIGVRKNGVVISLIKGLLFSFLLTMIFFIIFALLLTYTDLSEGYIPIVNSIIMVVSIAVGGIVISSNIMNKGWLNGAILGLLYVFIFVICGSIIFKSFNPNIYMFSKLGIGLISGAIGGMIGVNIK